MRSVGRTGSVRTPTTWCGVLDHLGLDRAVVVGHSMGAFVTALLAARHPDRVERAVLVDGGFAFPPPPDQSPR